MASYPGVFDLCIEALSDLTPRDIRRHAVTKRAEYAAGGVPEYYILSHRTEQQAFYTLDAATGHYVPLPVADGVVRSRVLPGFRFRQRDLGKQPGWDSLRADPVYAGFVLPGWTAAEQRAEAEAARADAEAARAEAEAAARRRAEAELALLRARIDPEKR